MKELKINTTYQIDNEIENLEIGKIGSNNKQYEELYSQLSHINPNKYTPGVTSPLYDIMH